MTTTHRGEPSAAGTPAADAPRARRGRRAGRDGAGGDAQGTRRLAALLLSPTLLVLALVIGYPVLAGFRESLYARGEGLDAEGFVVEGERFVGLGNYTAIFQGDRAEAFWNAFGNTTFFTVTTVALETVIGVAMALIMHQTFRGRALVRASILVPWAIPTAVSGAAVAVDLPGGRRRERGAAPADPVDHRRVPRQDGRRSSPRSGRPRRSSGCWCWRACR